jgi:hypothetical protein
MSGSRKAVFVIEPQGSTITWQVEVRCDDYFIERLQQLRRLVPPVTPLMAGTNLIIDKLRARLPQAVWRASADLGGAVESSSVVVSADGTFSCSAKHIGMRMRLYSIPVSIADFEAVHKSRPPGDVIYVSQGTIDARGHADPEFSCDANSSQDSPPQASRA